MSTGLERLNLNITKRCNLNCVMCDIPRRTSPGYELTSDEVTKLFLDARGLGIRWVCISGGEPLCRPDLPDLLTFANRQGIRVDLCTNGTLVNEKILRALAGSPKNAVTISIEGPENIHNIMRPHSFQAALKGLDKAIQWGIYTSTSTVLTRLNYPYLPELMDFLCRRGTKYFGVQQLHETFVRDHKALDTLKLSDADMLELPNILDKLKEISGRYGVSLITPPPPTVAGRKFACLSPRKSICVLSDGKVFGCWARTNIDFGSIRSETLSSLSSSDKMESFRTLAANGKCGGCSLSCHRYNSRIKQLRQMFSELLSYR
ncbi:MAG: radical SAM protein [Verrucomicrobiota bacterium]